MKSVSFSGLMNSLDERSAIFLAQVQSVRYCHDIFASRHMLQDQ
jgi:hypothetical protein